VRLLRSSLALGAVTSVLVVVGPGVVSPASAKVEDCTGINGLDTKSDPADPPGAAMGALQIREAQALLGGKPGGGVRVGVIDTAVKPQPDQLVDSQPAVYPLPTQYDGLYHQGTAVAGLINGPEQDGEVIGVAPGATVVDIPVYDVPPPSEEESSSSSDAVELTTANVAAGLERAANLNLDIVNVSVQVEHSPRLLAAVRALTRKKIIVVAASGDIPADGSPFEGELGGDRFGDDAAQEIFPAGYAHYLKEPEDPYVLPVTSTVADGVDPLSVLLPNSLTAVAVPTAGGVSYAPNKKRCTLTNPSSTYAAATVSGILALLKQRYRGENGLQLVARLKATAAGGPSGDPMIPNRFLGAGVVQPLEALTRVVQPDPNGDVEVLTQPTTSNEKAAIDPPEPDLLASAREDAVWWALGAGGLMLVLLLLRPVIGRRRRQSE
jgi:membrane-anchored mycosin MYCP